MSAEVRWLAEAIPEGQGWALDLGGGRGGLRPLLEQKGWRYVNVDLRPGRNGLAVCADAHSLPFRDGAFALIVAKDSLEHFENPWRAMEEIRRTLADGGTLVIWVPFMWGFHGDDFYRFTPLAFERFLKGFTIIRFDTPALGVQRPWAGFRRSNQAHRFGLSGARHPGGGLAIRPAAPAEAAQTSFFRWRIFDCCAEGNA
jgi:SAM-dependent methyltransferase